MTRWTLRPQVTGAAGSTRERSWCVLHLAWCFPVIKTMKESRRWLGWAATQLMPVGSSWAVLQVADHPDTSG